MFSVITVYRCMDRKSAGRIILIRHGETEANRSRCFADSDDIPLTDTGRSQSHALALRLSRESAHRY
jgi:broad specificity phosphatase PhoE